MQLHLFLGIPLEGAFREAFDAVSPNIRTAFLNEPYLSTLSCGKKTYLGKSVGSILQFSQLELSESHVRSLLKKILPEYPMETISLTLIPHAT